MFVDVCLSFTVVAWLFWGSIYPNESVSAAIERAQKRSVSK